MVPVVKPIMRLSGTNDQAEYINPFFPFLGYEIGNESALNSFRHFARYMNPEYKPIPSSIISEGVSFWHGAKDRGDGAMIAYGAARYALARGDKAEARELWPLIEWCLEYCNRKLTPAGVVASIQMNWRTASRLVMQTSVPLRFTTMLCVQPLCWGVNWEYRQSS